MFTRILVPLDGSAIAEKALPHARALGRTLEIPITLITVIETAAHFSTKKAYLDTLIEGGVRNSEEYLKKNMAAAYPVTDDPCAYCRQPLTASALQLVKKYRDFSNNEIKAALDTAERQLRHYVAPVVDLRVDTLQQQLAAETNGGPDVLNPVTPVVEQMNRLNLNVATGSAIDWQDKELSLAAAETIVSGEETRLTKLIAGLQTSVDERQAALKAKQSELTELQGKKTANSLLPQIEKRVSDAKWVGRATIVKNNLTGVLRSLTEAAKEASEELLIIIRISRDALKTSARCCALQT